MINFFRGIFLKTRSFLSTSHGKKFFHGFLYSITAYIIINIIFIMAISLTKNSSGILAFFHILLFICAFLFSLGFFLSIIVWFYININKKFAYIVISIPIIMLIRYIIVFLIRDQFSRNMGHSGGIFASYLVYFFLIIFISVLINFTTTKIKNQNSKKYPFLLNLTVLNSTVLPEYIDDSNPLSKISYILRPVYFRKKVLTTLFVQIGIKNNSNYKLNNVHFFDGYLHSDNKDDIFNLKISKKIISKYKLHQKVEKLQRERRATHISLKPHERSFLNGFIAIPKQNKNKLKIKVPLFLSFHQDGTYMFSKIYLKAIIIDNKVISEKIYFNRWEYVIFNF